MNIKEIIKNKEVIDYTHLGLGICKEKDNVIFVKNAIVGEVLDLKIINKKNNIYYATIDNIIKRSENRIEPKCEYYFKCGGCNISHMNYKEQLQFKNQTFLNTLKKQKLNIHTNILKINPNEKEFGYRNKITFSFLKQNNQIKLGLNEEKSNQIIRIKKCLLVNDKVNELLKTIEEQINKYDLTVFNKKTKKGLLKKLIIRINNENKILIFLKLNCTNLDEYLSIFDDILKTNKDVIFLSFENKKSNIKSKSKEDFYQTISNMKYKVSPDAFFQINTEQTTNIYNDIKKLIKPNNEIILDAYCGTGTIGQYISSKTKKVVGIDINKSAIKDAKENAILNNIKNTKYIAGDIEKIIDKYYNNQNTFETVILDPPRKGINISFINLLNQYLPKEIIYVSCQPSTLFRDLKLLQEKYNIVFIKKHDMFCQTHHIETLVKLEVKND